MLMPHTAGLRYDFFNATYNISAWRRSKASRV
jgi:hypothetical protein